MFDKSFLINPLYEYLKWLIIKIKYQFKYRKNNLRIGYLSFVHNTTFGRNNWIGKNNNITNTDIGNYSYVAGDCVIANCTIGKFCSIAPNVKIAPGRHPTHTFVSTHPVTFSKPQFMLKHFIDKSMFLSNKQVFIGNDVWIGANCLIVDGVTIGDGAIVAANSVVTKNVGAYEIVGGVPAKFIKKRFEEQEIYKLLELKWWDKGDDWIQDNISKFVDVKKIIADVESNLGTIQQNEN